MRLYFIAGEASGDLHGANLIRELKQRKSNLELRAWGGDYMQKEGAELVRHIKELAFMGFWEVAKNLRTILRLIKICKQDIIAWKPDAIVLIDYPGFNLRIARFAKQNGIPVYYYISPQLWAWKASRVKKIKRDVDRMITILPFEQEWYARHQVDVDYVGHPLLDAIDRYQRDPDFRNRNKLDARPIVAVLPGSRQQEIERKLPIMLGMAKRFPNYNFVVGGLSQHDDTFYEKIIKSVKAQKSRAAADRNSSIAKSNISVVTDESYALLQHARAAMVTSGTATLETALFEVPEVVCYKGSPISYQIAKRLIKVPYISLVNLIADKSVVKELIQADFNEDALAKELEDLMENETRRGALKSAYVELKSLLGGKGASGRTAERLLELIEAQTGSPKTEAHIN